MTIMVSCLISCTIPQTRRMLWIILITQLIKTVESICPSECLCSLDDKGRRQVVCSKGGMVVPIPISMVDPAVEVLKITAPDDSQNSLTIGPIFQQFTRLEEIHIVKSNVPAIGRHSFWGVSNLKVLNLSHNNISQVLESNFRGLVQLTELYLDDNRIESMHSGTFRHLTELRVLSIAKNRITKLAPRQFLSLAKLHHLDLSWNAIEELTPEVFKDVQEMRVFSCRGCSLKSINTYMYRLLSSLTHLDLGDNQFKYIAKDEFQDLKKLQVLRLDGNQLPVVLEGTFSHDKTSQLQTLNLARNRLAKVTATAFANQSTLMELNLGYNKLNKIEAASFLPLVDTLKVLDVSGNNFPVTELKYILQVAVKLKELSIADVSLGKSDIPLGLLVYLEHLKFLNLSGNHLMHFPSQVLAPVSKLTELDLSRNSFQGLDERLLLRLESIPVLHLERNPWTCDHCHIGWMLNRVNKSTDISNVVCAMPYSVAGMTLGSLKRSSLEWCHSGLDYNEDGVAGLSLARESNLGLIAAIAAVGLLVITVTVVTIVIFYSRHHAAYYYTHEEKRGPEHDSIFENHAAVFDENGKPKKVSIATIDEITKDPDLQILANGT